MPGRAGKVKGGKQKVEKKEKKEKIPPVVVPITVNTPDGRQVELKGISTDVLLDVRHYLIQHVDTTHLTNYSFSHEIRGDLLPDTLEISALRPCILDMVEEDYSEKQAVAHVRRLLDIVACTTAFGPSNQQKRAPSADGPKSVNGTPNGFVNGTANGSSNGVDVGMANGVEDVGLDVSANGAANGKADHAVGGSDGESVASEEPEKSTEASTAEKDAPRDGPKENGHSDTPKGLGFGLGRKKAEGVSKSDVQTGVSQEDPISNGSQDVNQVVTNGLVKGAGKGKLKGKGDAMKAMAAAEAAVKRGDREGMYPPSRLGTFYEFLSMAHLQSPLQSIKRSLKQPTPEARAEGDYFLVDVRLCNGKLVTVTASKSGFYPTGKPSAVEHELLDVLKKQSGAFTQAYDDLIQGFLDRNQFGNIPTGFRANTFVVPPPFAQNPSNPSDLPVEDELWGGNGGGGGLDVSERSGRPWKALFRKLQGVPCGTPEERIVRDRKAFLLHNLFVDVAVRTAVDVVRELDILDILNETEGPFVEGFKTLYEAERSNLQMTVKREALLAGGKRGISNSGPFVVVSKDDDVIKELRPLDDFSTGDTVSKGNLDRKNVLKGLVADESTALADLPTLGMVTVYYQGLTVVVNALGEPGSEEGLEEALEVEQLDGGENALNVNSLRVLLHRASGKGPTDGEGLAAEADQLYEETLERSHGALGEVDQSEEPVLRWELGACWIQHLQDEKKKAEEERKKAAEEREERIANGEGPEEAPLELVHVGERKGFKVEARPLRKGEEVKQLETKEETEEERAQRERNEAALKALLNDVAWKKVCDSKTGLHSKPIDELVADARTFRNEVALPKLIADFASLELSPVDGRTLTDFMHTRGLNMNQLGDLAKKAEELPHIKEMCVMEMETRALKRVLKAGIAACPRFSLLASVLASALSAFLGEGPLAADTWRWVEKFVELHYRYKLSESARSRLRKLEVLRGLCHKVGIEIAPRNYDLTSDRPFYAADIISMVPVYKSVACTTADGRQLLEQSKLALDKGKLDESVQSGCKALSKIIAVCGPRHRMTAGAYSLLAVVLYHTGDFNQATIYQQKALDINERELGLDHPDTMKSFGDLAVFYYRLQHTELALKYVHRALYLLNLICGSEHPNSAATYINVAMMEEGMGNVPIALRYLHEALKCNERLLGADHIQTAAAYHALAIVLSLMEAYSLSVQHEETTFRILTDKLGPDDLKTQDAAAWLDYFDSKALEQQEVARTGGRKPDATIASKGHLSVDDLLNFINKEADQKEGAHKRAKRPPQPIYQRFRASVSSKPPLINETQDSRESVSSEADSETESEEPVSSQEGVTSSEDEEGDVIAEVAAPERLAVSVPEEDDGEWQEATPRSKAQKVAHSSNPPTRGRAFTPRGAFPSNRGGFSSANSRGGFVRDVTNRYPRPSPRSNPDTPADVARSMSPRPFANRGLRPADRNGLRLQGVKPGFIPGPRNSHSPKSVLPSPNYKPALRLLKPVNGQLVEPPEQSPVDATKDGILARPASEGPVETNEVTAAPPAEATTAATGPSKTEEVELTPKVVEPSVAKSWSFKDIVMAKPRKNAPGAVKVPSVVSSTKVEKTGEAAPISAKAPLVAPVAEEKGAEEAEASKTGPSETAQEPSAVEKEAIEETVSSQKREETSSAPVLGPNPEATSRASEKCELSPPASVTTSERSDSPALSESSSQRSIPLTPFCKKSDTPPITQIPIPVPIPGPAVVPVTPVRRFTPPVPVQPAFQQGPQYAYPPLLPTPQFRVQFPLPSANYQLQNVNGVHVPVPQNPQTPHYMYQNPLYQQYSPGHVPPPTQWISQPSARPFRPNPLATEFKPSGSPPLQNPSPTLNPAAVEFVPGSFKKAPISDSVKLDVSDSAQVEESVKNRDVNESEDEEVVESGDVKREDDVGSEEAAEFEGKAEGDQAESAETDSEAAADEETPKEVAQPSEKPVTVASHQHVDDVSAAVLLDAKAAAEAAIKAALAKGNSGSYGSLGGLKLSADAAPFQPSAGIMSRTKSCGSLSQDGERDMVSVSVR